MEAINFKQISGIKVDIEPPANTPTKLARINAHADPKNTANGFFELPLNVKVASWVLSPTSAKNTVMNEDKSKFIIIRKRIY